MEFFISENWVVELTEARCTLPEYRRFSGLRCEIQVQTILDHAWAEMAHETIYKPMSDEGFGAAAVDAMRKRLRKVMRDYLQPAGWAHFRRKIFENHRTSPTPLTTDLLERIAGLYRIEEEIRGAPPDARRQGRQERSRPQVEELRIAVDDALRRLSPKSAMAKALAYGRKRWEALTHFLDDGRAEIDNNIAERAIRSIAIGRKNWLFAGSRAGGERAAAIYSVIETAKLNGIEPQTYIAGVIEKIASDWPASRWDELLPWNWRPAGEPAMAEAAQGTVRQRGQAK